MTIRELEAAFKSVPDELKDLPVKYYDDVHYENVRCAWVETEGGEKFIKLCDCYQGYSDESPLFADDTVKKTIERDREGRKPFHLDSSKDVNVTVTFGTEGAEDGCVVTLVASDPKNLSIHTGRFSIIHPNLCKTTSPNYRFSNLLKTVQEALWHGQYGNQLATEMVREDIRAHAYLTIEKWIADEIVYEQEESRRKMEEWMRNKGMPT